MKSRLLHAAAAEPRPHVNLLPSSYADELTEDEMFSVCVRKDGLTFVFNSLVRSTGGTGQM